MVGLLIFYRKKLSRLFEQPSSTPATVITAYISGICYSVNLLRDLAQTTLSDDFNSSESVREHCSHLRHELDISRQYAINKRGWRMFSEQIAKY